MAALAVAGCQSADSLAGPIWQWTAPRATNAAGQSVTPDPTSYTIEFLTNGTLNIQADCNRLTGTYRVGVPLDLTIAVTPPTRPGCGESSVDRVFLDSLGQISSYSVASGQLNLFVENDVGAMQFQRQGT